MPEKKAVKGTAGLKHGFYKIEGDRLDRTRQSCPECGRGAVLAQDEGRVDCGRCGVTEFAKE